MRVTGSSFALEVLFPTDCPLLPEIAMAARHTSLPLLEPSRGLAETWGHRDPVHACSYTEYLGFHLHQGLFKGPHDHILDTH